MHAEALAPAAAAGTGNWHADVQGDGSGDDFRPLWCKRKR